MTTKGDTALTELGAPVVRLEASGPCAVLRVAGPLNENFLGFGAIPDAVTTLAIDVSDMTSMSSSGVREWIGATHELPAHVKDVYLLGCRTFFVDNLNMIMGFSGRAKVLTIAAPYTCPSCGTDHVEVIDVYADRAKLMDGRVPGKDCPNCTSALEFDEIIGGFFAFVERCVATSVSPQAAAFLSSTGLYRAPGPSGKPPRLTRLVHGSVNYFRIKGSIGAMFRGRPLLAGAEGDVVIDLADVRAFEAAGRAEWDRLMAALVKKVESVVLVDVGAPLLRAAVNGLFRFPAGCALWSILVPYTCRNCGREFEQSLRVASGIAPPDIPPFTCDLCGGKGECALHAEELAALPIVEILPAATSEAVITQRADLLSRAALEDTVRRSAPPLALDEAILGKYRILRKLSSGGMAEVFLAKQIGIGGFEKPVALKRILRSLLDQKREAVDLFLNEAKISARLNHPNIVQVIDVAELQGALYIAMEYVDGLDLAAVFEALAERTESLWLGEVLYIARAVASALHHAYFSTDLDGTQLHVVHRDLSPHNVLVGFDGSVRLADFGVAMSSVTSVNAPIAGKWTYMAPEQAQGGALDHRTDLFALGILLYQMCAGEAPFSGKNARQTTARICAGDYRPLRQVAPRVPEVLERLVEQLLEVDPDKRPANGNAVAANIDQIANTLGIPLNPTTTATTMTRLFPGAPRGKAGDATLVSSTLEFDPDMSPLSGRSFEDDKSWSIPSAREAASSDAKTSATALEPNRTPMPAKRRTFLPAAHAPSRTGLLTWTLIGALLTAAAAVLLLYLIT